MLDAAPIAMKWKSTQFQSDRRERLATLCYVNQEIER